jgi:N-methylhydantoinase A
VPRSHRLVFLAGAWRDAAVHDRHTLLAGQSFAGPAIVDQEDTTVVILPGWTAKLDVSGNLHLTRSERP